MKIRLVAIVFVSVLILLGAGDDSTRMDKLGHRMMCVCGACNQYVIDCNHVGCAYSTRMRMELSAAVDKGTDDAGILQSFVDEYGAIVLAAPTKTGFDRVAWILPYMALVLGIGVVVIALQSLKVRAARAHTAASGGSNSDLDRFRVQARKDTEI
jgi:cytochrome c-type biogenesis protein CcmH/NrfF